MKSLLFVLVKHKIQYRSLRVFKIEGNKREITMGYYNQLIQFLEQAKTNDLKTKHFGSEYNGTKVKVSFGQGNSALIPWISFLIDPNTTSKGIYPAYLYYKDSETLFLTYGISESNTPDQKWNVTDSESIREYFDKKGLAKPARYGQSLVFKSYNVESLPEKEIMEKDLNELIQIYKSITFSTTKVSLPDVHFHLNQFKSDISISGLSYSSKLILRFCASLITKPFVILTGLSGSGKTKLAQAFVKWICQDEIQYRLIPVGADWTNREPLLGYPNALKPEEYVKPDSGVLDLIIHANSNPELPYFLILDEMNLSHVERYFADFLSAMESKEKIPLYPEGTVNNGVPSNLHLPANLFIIGTVNIDETTNMFSPKVLDRANTIEFRVLY